MPTQLPHQHSRRILEQITDGFYALDHAFRFTDVNAAAELLLGRTRNELLGRNVWEAFPPAIETPLYPAYHEALATGMPVTFEFYYPPFDHWIEARVFPGADGLSVFFRDITESRSLVQTLRDSEAKYRTLIDHLPVVVYALAPDEQQTRMYFSPRHEALTGYALEETLADTGNWLERVHPDDHLRVTVENDRSEACGDPFRAEYRLRRKDGTYVWVLDECVPVRDETGQITAWQGVLLDITERVQVEESQLRLAAIVASSSEAIMSTTLDGVIISWNSAAERLYGYSTADVIGQSVTMLTPPGSLDDIAGLLTRVRKGEAVKGYETIRLTQDGRLIDVSLGLAPIRDTSGSIVAISSVARDITELRRAEAAAAREYDLLQTVMEHLPDEIYVKDTASNFLRLNHATARVLGLADPADAIGKSDHDFWPEALAEEYVADERLLLETGEPMLSKPERQAVGGDGRWVLATKVPFRDADGEIVGLVGINRDITTLRQQQEEMTRLAAIVECSQDAIIGKRLDGTITSWNSAAARLYGYTASEAVGRSIAMLIPPGRYNDLPDLLDRVARGGHVQGYEAHRQTKDGRILNVALTISPVVDRDGAVTGASVIARDVTELRRLQEERDRLYAELEAEFQRAAEVQAHLLPHAAPEVPGYELAGVCLPARQVGGDFYDWMVEDDVVRFSLGDVMGKGMAASLLTATVRAALRSVTHLPVSAAVETVNHALAPDLMQSDSFITLFHAALDSTSGQLSYIDAGHGLAFIQRRDGAVERLRQHGLPLGVLSDAEYPVGTTILEPGDTLVVYSDGLPDMRPELKLDALKLAEQIGELPNARAKLDRLVSLVANVEKRPDDLTLVLLQRREEGVAVDDHNVVRIPAVAGVA